MKLSQQTVDTALYEGRSYMSKGGRKRWRQHVLWDEELPGFGLRITPTNRKSFIVSYRAGGRKRTKTLGAAGKLKLEEARQRAAELLQSLAGETDPAAGPEPTLAGVETVAQLANAYVEQELKTTVPSWYADQRLIQIHVKPALGRTPVAEVTARDLAIIKNRVARRFPADSRRLTPLLAGMFEWAAKHGLWSSSPGRGGRAAAGPPPAESPAASAPPAPLPPAAELATRLAEAERERDELAARLDEVSTSGAEMLAQLTDQATARRELEAELEKTRHRLRRAAADGPPEGLLEEHQKKLANLGESVEQLMAALAEAKSERAEMADQLAAAQAASAERGRKMKSLTRGRDALETRLREAERRAALLKAGGRLGGGGRRGIFWLAIGLVAGALLTLLAQRALAPAVTAAPPAAAKPAVATAEPPPDGGPRSAGGPPPAAGEPASAAATTGVAEPPAPAAAAAGSPPPAGDTDPAATAADDAEAAVRAWAAAWSEQRVDDYLAAYSERFIPPQGMGRDEWSSRRRNRLLRPASIQVTLADLRRTVAGADRVSVSFEQSYQTPSYSDSVRKTLEMVREDGGWKILTERTP